jgi:hypothetical protein
MNNKLKSKQDKLGNEIKLNSVQSDEGRERGRLTAKNQNGPKQFSLP